MFGYLLFLVGWFSLRRLISEKEERTATAFVDSFFIATITFLVFKLVGCVE